MDRLTRLHAQLSASPSDSTNDVFVSSRSDACPQSVYETVLSPGAVAFVAELAATFHPEVQQVTRLLSWLETRTRQHSTLPIAQDGSCTICVVAITNFCIDSCLRTNACVALFDGLQLHRRRQVRRLATEVDGSMPQFLEETRAVRQDETWCVDPQVAALRDRRVDMGDVSPADRDMLLSALNSGAQVRCVDVAVGATDRQ